MTVPINIEVGGAELLDRIEPLWIQLRGYHVALSANFGSQMAAATFDQRKQGLLTKSDGGGMHVALAGSPGSSDLVGYCVTLFDRQKTGEIESIYVHDSVRGKGIGERLIDIAMRWLDEHRISKRVVIAAFENQRVMHLYERFGFKPRLIQMEWHNGGDAEREDA